ncbi:Gfo/Idh/MocA family protein [Nocardia sp. NPDC020380]|uniref:Gfo/Idh/MocA family protein n=1 Tax=Nocardia sp. NPDC020380 TaxID=3364309 RepID=UPI0037874CB5
MPHDKLARMESGLLPVAVIGLGDIAEKAYLPVLTAEPGLDIHLMTRNRERLDRVADRYRLPNRHSTLDSVLASGVRAAFVHAATSAHVELCEALLQAGIDVFVDKPLDYTLAGARRLVELAESRERSLMVGFNRRYAPAYTEAAQRDRSLIVLQKNRHGQPEVARTFVYDDFIHVVDTLRFLMPAEITEVRTRFRGSPENGELEHVVLELSGDGVTALGIMNRCSGITEEILEISGGNTKYKVVNLGDGVDYTGGVATALPRGDWTPVGSQRGIQQAVDHFLDAVRAGKTLDARDALRTHEVCEQIVREIDG